jgi:hypothetical protein
MQPQPPAQEHPAPQQIERFVRGESTPAETRAVVRHLLVGCRTCREVARPLWPSGPAHVLGLERLG